MFCRVYKVQEWKSWAVTFYDDDGAPTDRESEYFPLKREAVERAKELEATENIKYMRE